MRRLQKIRTYPWVAGSLNSEYKAEYPPKEAPRDGKQGYVQQRNQANAPSPAFDATSTQRADYTVRVAAAVAANFVYLQRCTAADAASEACTAKSPVAPVLQT